ncbi:MAG: hypothetical protein ACXQT2_01365 [Methanotrichaceae archaeon]
MGEMKVKVPEGIPMDSLREKINELIREEEVRWTLFETSREELSIDRAEMEDLEQVRESVWKEEKKKYGL